MSSIVNGHPDPTPCSRSDGVPVPPYAMYFRFHDLPAGVVDLGGGLLCAGALGNEAALVRAVKAAGPQAGEGTR